MNLQTKTLRSMGWSSSSRLTQVLLQIVITAILAHLLTPNDFGLIAMVTVFSNFIAVFSDFGLASALIQKKEINEELLSSVFWIVVGLGLLLTIALAACGPLIAAFYSEPVLVTVIVALSTVFFIQSLGSVQQALLLKTMNFRAVAIIRISASATAGVTGILLAFAGFGVWSLVWNAILLAVVTVTLTWMFSRWVPHFHFSWQQARTLIAFGSNLTGATFVDYLHRNADNLLVGRYLGPISLGFYNLAYNLLLVPLFILGDVFGSVMFPALSQIHEDKKKVRVTCISANRHIASLSLPLLALLVVVAPQFVRILYGEQWISAIPLVQILALVCIVQSLSLICAWVYLSQGRTDILFKWYTLATVVFIISFIVGLRAGIEGVAIAYTAAMYLLAYPNFAIPFKLIDLRVRDYFAPIKKIAFATLLLGIIALSVRVFLEGLGGVPNVIILIIVTAISLLSYLGLIFLLERSLITETLQLINEARYSPADVAENQG